MSRSFVGRRRRTVELTAWTVALAIALLWPSRASSPVAGVPLDRPFEAILIGVVVPCLWWIDRQFLFSRWARVGIAGVLCLKVIGAFALPQHGLCARFSTVAPFQGVSNTIPIDEPTGSLRSWDVRADWRDPVPRCTAIVSRSYYSSADFPVWFLNVLDSIRPDHRDLEMDVSGFVTVNAPGSFGLRTGSGMSVRGRADERPMRVAPGGLEQSLTPGTHAIDMHATFAAGDWALVPLWEGREATSWNWLTVTRPRQSDPLIAGAFSLSTTAAVILLIAGWSVAAASALWPATPLLAWAVFSAILFAWLGAYGLIERSIGPLLFTSLLVPVRARHRNLVGAFILIGVPWLAFFVGRSLPQIGRFTTYTHDDWLIFQSAAYRIFLNRYWLEGGSATFYFQPLYRWIAGSLHIVFGDSSVGEMYWDAACVALESLVAFQLVKASAGFRPALVASAAVLTTFTLSTPWYLIGRGLSEISAAGWLSLAVFMLLRSRLGRLSSAVAAGVFATLMFYTRLNHLVLALCLIVLLMPLTMPSRLDGARAALTHVRWSVAAVYLATFGFGVALFALRTWWFTGVFSLLYGTSFPVQETGLRFATIGSAETWGRISESLMATLWMNEPPHPDPRAVLVVVGLALSVLAVVQIPGVRRLPLAPAVMSIAGVLGAFVAYAHHYPGRLTIHLLPFTTTIVVCAVVMVFGTR